MSQKKTKSIVENSVGKSRHKWRVSLGSNMGSVQRTLAPEFSDHGLAVAPSFTSCLAFSSLLILSESQVAHWKIRDKDANIK